MARPNLVNSIHHMSSDTVSAIGRVDLRSQMSYDLCEMDDRNEETSDDDLESKSTNSSEVSDGSKPLFDPIKTAETGAKSNNWH